MGLGLEGRDLGWQTGLGLAGLGLHGLGVAVLGVAGLGLAGLVLTKRRDLPVFTTVASLLLRSSESTQHKTGYFLPCNWRANWVGPGPFQNCILKKINLEFNFWNAVEIHEG